MIASRRVSSNMMERPIRGRTRYPPAQDSEVPAPRPSHPLEEVYAGPEQKGGTRNDSRQERRRDSRLVASRQIKLRRIDGWRKIATVLSRHTVVHHARRTYRS